jgi:hypothetical protein
MEAQGKKYSYCKEMKSHQEASVFIEMAAKFYVLSELGRPILAKSKQGTCMPMAN